MHSRQKLQLLGQMVCARIHQLSNGVLSWLHKVGLGYVILSYVVLH